MDKQLIEALKTLLSIIRWQEDGPNGPEWYIYPSNNADSIIKTADDLISRYHQ